MPHVRQPGVLKAVYDETLRAIQRNELPTELIDGNRTLYRAADLGKFLIGANGNIDRKSANEFLRIRDEDLDRNRFTGKSFNPGVPSCGGLYCSLQHSALLSELLHYAGPQIPRGQKTGFADPNLTLECKSIVKVRMMGSVLAADLSPRNPGARQFVAAIGKSVQVQQALHRAGTLAMWMWEHMFDGEDCSVARGIGLAIAEAGYRALKAFTVRPSVHADAEAGENIVFFGHMNVFVESLWVEEAYLFPRNEKPITYPVVFSP